MKTLHRLKNALRAPRRLSQSNITDAETYLSAIIMTTKESQTRELAYLAIEALNTD